VIPRAVCEHAFRIAVGACDPAPRVHAAVARLVPKDKAVLGVAIGKAALAMARGAGPVDKGIAVAPQLDGTPLPLGWTARDAAHPVPDSRSFEAGDAVLELVKRAGADDIVLVLISGGASSLVEVPAAGISRENYVSRVVAKMGSGAPIAELNALRRSLSQIKGGRLAEASRARVITLAVSDVIGDDLHVIGSGPTVAAPPSPVVQRRRAQDRIGAQERVARGDVAVVIAPMRSFADALRDALAVRGIVLPFHAEPMAGHVTALERGIHWGEPTLTVPADHGEGGRAQQLALDVAHQLRGTDASAFVAGSDGVDGPPPKGRPAPAGAYVDGTTWDAIIAAGIDPAAALQRRDAGTALAAVGALVITGPTGINHADIAVVG
jgi:hydroxypyruvate reductase